MTIHHDLALLLAVALVVACIFGPRCSAEAMTNLIHFAGSIVIATFAHAQGVKTGTATASKKSDHHETQDGK